MKHHTTELSIEVECDECGTSLEATSPRSGLLLVKPCQKCLDKAYEDGENEG